MPEWLNHSKNLTSSFLQLLMRLDLDLQVKLSLPLGHIIPWQNEHTLHCHRSPSRAFEAVERLRLLKLQKGENAGVKCRKYKQGLYREEKGPGCAIQFQGFPRDLCRTYIQNGD